MKKELLNKKIANRIVHLRQSKGWSQSDLARATHKDRQATQKLESGLINPTVFSLWEVAQALNISLSELVDIDLT